MRFRATHWVAPTVFDGMRFRATHWVAPTDFAISDLWTRPLYYESTGFRFWKVSLPPMNQYKGMDDGFSKVGKPVQ